MGPSHWLAWPTRWCRHVTSPTILLPLFLLGLLGFFINSHVQFATTPTFVGCQPKTNIVFLKTHKCAGSSIQNIFMRYGDNHNLTFVLPEKNNYLGHPIRFRNSLVPTPRPANYNILTHHARLDYGEMRKLMPPSTVFVTIVRDPVEVFASSFSYYRLDKFFGGSLHKFVRRIPVLPPSFLKRRFIGKFGINQMLFDLGADPEIFDNDTLVREYVNLLDSWFDLVLVTERVDESLVLLRNLLCWDVDDVVTFKKNARSPRFKTTLTAKEQAALRLLNRADQILYDHFVDRLEKQVEALGQMQKSADVALLQQRTRMWYNLCVEGEEPPDSSHPKPSYYLNPRVMVFEPRHDVRNDTCTALTMEELPYTDYLRSRQIALLKLTESTSEPNDSSRVEEKIDKTLHGMKRYERKLRESNLQKKKGGGLREADTGNERNSRMTMHPPQQDTTDERIFLLF